MPSGSIIIRHSFGGGWATAFGPSAEVGPDQAGIVQIPFMWVLDNMFFTLDGGIRKIGGTKKLNATAISGGPTVRGLFDYWKDGGGGSSTQKRVAYAGTQLWKDDADGSFTSIATGLTDGAVPSFTVFENELIISSASSDAPVKWNQSGSATTFGTGPTPAFAFCVSHKNQVWASGVQANASRLYYSPSLANGGVNGDWVADGGHIDIDPGDGDVITGIASHKDVLWVFKGPYKGSIHRISGADGSSASRATFIGGLGAVSHNTIFPFGNDLGFVWSDGTVHSLAATDAFGDFQEANLSRPIDDWIAAHVNTGALNLAWVAVDEVRGEAQFCFAIDSSSENNVILAMDYRFSPVRWMKWPAYSFSSIARVVDASDGNRPKVFGGDTSGFIFETQRSNRGINEGDAATTISANAKTPYMNYGTPFQKKTIASVAVGIQPKGNYNLTFGWTPDNQDQQTQTVTQGGADVLSEKTFSARTISGTSEPVGGTTRLISLTTPAGLAVGNRIVIYGTTDYNGEHVVTAIEDVDRNWVEIAFDHETSQTGKYIDTLQSSPFIMDTSVLGGAQFVNRFMELISGGEFRSIQYELLNNGLNEDLEVHYFATIVEHGARSLEN